MPAATYAAGQHLHLLVDGWPGEQRFSLSVEGREIYKVLTERLQLAFRLGDQVVRALDRALDPEQAGEGGPASWRCWC